jgi:GT2 family glycosyltransferase
VPAARRPSVTVVVATFGRPDALRWALQSARDQTFEDWQAIVVGDACPEAGASVSSLHDDRIRFVNLPRRQGEQSRPNSVGLALADTPFVALLNHDDLWVPDHLERAVTALGRSGADLYAGSAAFAREVRTLPDGTTRPVFSERTPDERTLADAFAAHFFVFEPVSSWVMGRSLVDRVGPWTPAAHLYRTPAIDWLLRAWRSGAELVHDPTVTVLKVNTHYREGSHRYRHGGADLALLHGLMDSLGPQATRALVESDLGLADRLGLPPPRDPWRPFGPGARAAARAARLRDPTAVERFLRTGHDEFEDVFREWGRGRGHTLRQLLEARTGEELTDPSDLDELVSHCRRRLAGTDGS